MERAHPGLDIISKIPKELCLHILTLLPRKYAIRTGALSSRWEDLWKRRFSHPTILTFGRATESKKEQRELAKAIQEYMAKHGSQKIEVFNLYFYPGKKHAQKVDEWIEQAMANGVEEFNLDFSQASMGSYPCKQLARRAMKFELKECLFKSNKVLTCLSLKDCRLQRYFKFTYFDCLEILCLRQVNINDFMLEKLTSNCPSLEVLELRQCLNLEHIRFPATKLKLRKLTIANCYNTKEVDILAPGLRSFYFFGKLPDTFVMFGNMPLLNDVIIKLPSEEAYHNRSIQALVFMWLDYVQVLTLCSSSLWFLYGMWNITWIGFEHLKELQLQMESMIYSHLSYVYSFLKHCQLPLLERLFVELPASWLAYDESDYWQKKLEAPSMITFGHLTMIKMNNFKGHSNEMLLLDYFMQGAINLELVILVFPPEFYTLTTSITRASIVNDIMLKPRASVKAKMVMMYSDQDDNSLKAAHSNAIQELLYS